MHYKCTIGDLIFRVTQLDTVMLTIKMEVEGNIVIILFAIVYHIHKKERTWIQ